MVLGVQAEGQPEHFFHLKLNPPSACILAGPEIVTKKDSSTGMSELKRICMH